LIYFYWSDKQISTFRTPFVDKYIDYLTDTDGWQ